MSLRLYDKTNLAVHNYDRLKAGFKTAEDQRTTVGMSEFSRNALIVRGRSSRTRHRDYVLGNTGTLSACFSVGIIFNSAFAS